MTSILVKLFVKNNEDILNPKVREKYGVLSGTVGIVCNIFLCLIKFFAGLVSGSIAITADAFNNLSDAGSSIVTLIGFKLASRPADKEHPYGHGRYEYITGLVIAAAIIVMGFELFRGSVDKIINPEPVVYSNLSAFILAASIAVKLWMCLFNRKLGKKLESSAMLATSADSLNDCIATAVALIALFAGHPVWGLGKNGILGVDGWAGVFVALFVVWAGFSTARETIEPLLGQAPDPAFVKNVENHILSHKGIIGIHDMIVHDYGPGRIFISLHAEIPYDMNALEAHDIIDEAESEIERLFNCEISIHMDPVILDDEKTNSLKALVEKIIGELDERLTIHDFRITDGPLRTNLIFDAVLPFDFHMTDTEVIDHIVNSLKKENEKYFAVVHIDRAVL